MRALRNLRSVLIHRVPQAQSATSASPVYPGSHLRAFAAAPSQADFDKRPAGYKSWNRLCLALGAAFVTGVVYEEVSQSSRCEQQASSGQTKVAVCSSPHCNLAVMCHLDAVHIHNAARRALKEGANQSSLRKRSLSMTQKKLEYG